MKTPFSCRNILVKVLTICILLVSASCSVLHIHNHEVCKSRAYLRNVLADYLKERYHAASPVRMAVIPFSVPANLAAYSNELPGLGNQFAWQIKEEFLATGEIPIVEVLNRQDWPGKKEEFHTGNFGAIAQGLEADYDLILIGFLENLRSLGHMTVHTKLIETRTGVTIWNGKSSVTTDRRDQEYRSAWFGLNDRTPNRLYTTEMVNALSQCVVRDVLEDEMVPG